MILDRIIKYVRVHWGDLSESIVSFCIVSSGSQTHYPHNMDFIVFQTNFHCGGVHISYSISLNLLHFLKRRSDTQYVNCIRKVYHSILIMEQSMFQQMYPQRVFSMKMVKSCIINMMIHTSLIESERNLCVLINFDRDWYVDGIYQHMIENR